MSSKYKPADFLMSSDVESAKRRRVSNNKQQTQQQQQQQPTTKLPPSPLMPKNNNHTTINSASMGMRSTLTANIVASINDQGLRTHDFVIRRREPTGQQQVPGRKEKDGLNNNNNNKRRINKAGGTSSIGDELDYRDGDIGAALTLATMHMLPPPLARRRKTEEEEEEEEEEEKTVYRYPPAASDVLKKEASPLVMVFKGAPILERRGCRDGREKGEEGGEMATAGSQLLQQQQQQVINSTVVDANPDKVPLIGSVYDVQYLQNIYIAAKSLKMASGLQDAVLKRVLERGQAEAE